MKKQNKIIKEIRKVTGTAEGITFTKEEKRILNIKEKDLVEVIKHE